MKTIVLTFKSSRKTKDIHKINVFLEKLKVLMQTLGSYCTSEHGLDLSGKKAVWMVWIQTNTVKDPDTVVDVIRPLVEPITVNRTIIGLQMSHIDCDELMKGFLDAQNSHENRTADTERNETTES